MIVKVFPDKEKVKSITKLVEEREKFVSQINKEEFPTIASEHYYEIIKELATSLLLLDSKKALGENAHKETIEDLSKYKEFSYEEITILQDLRIKRNKNSYEGKQISKEYLENKEEKLKLIISNLKNIISKKLES